MKRFIVGLIFATSNFLSADTVATETSAPKGQSMWQTLIMIAIALAFFYLILWRPEQRKKKAIERQRSLLKVGDKVTAIGILGTVDKINTETVVLKMIDGSKIEVLKAAINDVKGKEEKKPQVTSP